MDCGKFKRVFMGSKPGNTLENENDARQERNRSENTNTGTKIEKNTGANEHVHIG
jgi:hypothetical protein